MNGFKKLPFDWRARVLSELQGAKLAVWLAHYWRSDKDDKVEMSNSQIMRECDLGLSAVKYAKRWLKDNGWLVVDKAAYRDPISNQWISPELMATFPRLESNPMDEVQGSRVTLGPGLDSNRGSRVEKAAAGKVTLPVDTLLPVGTYGSDATRLRVNTEEEAVDESASASDFSNRETPDILEKFKKHSVETELIPITESYNLNGNRSEEAAKLYDVLEEVHFAGCHLVAAIEYFRSISDTFIADRISTWGGLLKMLRSGGMIQQFRSAQQLANKLNPTAYQKAQADSFGTPAYGAAVAKIIGDKKAGKKSNPAHGDGKHVS